MLKRAAIILALSLAGCRPQPQVGEVVALRALLAAQFDLVHHVEIQSEENAVAGGTTYYSDVSHHGQIWLLKQRKAAASEWKRYGIFIAEGRAYYARLDTKVPQVLGAECAECHVNGPKALRGRLRTGSEAERDAINLAVEDVGLVRPHYTKTEPDPQGSRLALKPCTKCHDGQRRNWLTSANVRTIGFMLQHGYMPPYGEVSDEQRAALGAWLSKDNRSVGF